MMSHDRLLRIIDQSENIDDVLKQVPDLDFSTYICTLMRTLNVTKFQLSQRTNINNHDYYQILNGSTYPSRDNVIQLSIGLQLGLKDTNNLLSISHNGALYPKVNRDAIIIVALKQHYSVTKTNELLDNYNYDILH